MEKALVLFWRLFPLPTCDFQKTLYNDSVEKGGGSASRVCDL